MIGNIANLSLIEIQIQNGLITEAASKDSGSNPHFIALTAPPTDVCTCIMHLISGLAECIAE